MLLTKRIKQTTSPEPFQLTADVFDAIRATVGTLAPETGGMLGGDPDVGIVTRFNFDHGAVRTRASYSPDYRLLTRVLEEQWNPVGVRLMGFVHSHPRGCRTPSHGDETYARLILKGLPDLQRLVLPIVMSDHDGRGFELLSYAAVRTTLGVTIQAVPVHVGTHATVPGRTDHGAATFDRVRTAYDLDHLQHARIVAVGCGGAAEFIEMLARTGIGEFVLIDKDVVAEPNLATQQTYRRDIGRMKVEALAERIIDINPNARIKALYVSSDQLTDDDFKRLLRVADCHGSGTALLCGMTDAFDAQARVNRLALQFAVPSLCAQVYFEGRAAEVSFTHPDTTAACHRCMLRSRYEAYLRRGFRNDITSNGTPIGSTGRLNTSKFFVAMALLHHSTQHPRWGDMLRRIGNRNLIQLRMHPDVDLPVFARVFRGADDERILCDEAVWLPQLPDNPKNGFPTCPDCGGSGDLRRAVGTFRDTRDMRF
jgi:ThiF family